MARGVPERVGDRRFPEGRVVFTGCGTSFHAAQTGGEACRRSRRCSRRREADLLVASATRAGRAHAGGRAGVRRPGLAHHRDGEGPLAELADEVIVVTPEIEESYCHTASYTCAVAALDALRGEDIRWLRPRSTGALGSARGRRLGPVAVVGAGRDWPTAQEAVLKLSEGAYIAAEAHHTEQILHGHLAAIDENVRVFVLEGEGRAAERAGDVVRALGEIGAGRRSSPRRTRSWTSSASSC